MKSNVEVGSIFGLLKIIEETDKYVQPSGQTQRAFLCLCNCGNTTKVRLSHLKHGRVQSCGCLKGEPHRDTKSPLYTLWRGIKNRCYGHKTIQPHIYKDRGIKMCDSWRNSYIVFREWARSNGYKKGLQIDRLDNDGDYGPENCRFVTPTQQANNRRNTIQVRYKGTYYPIMDILREKRLQSHHNTIRRRLKRGWPVEKAIDTPIRVGNY